MSDILPQRPWTLLILAMVLLFSAPVQPAAAALAFTAGFVPATFSCCTLTASPGALGASAGGGPWLLFAAGILACGGLNLALAYRRRQRKD